MFRYFDSNNSIKDDAVRIEGTDFLHLKNTLRAQVGDKLSIVSGECEYIAEIQDINIDYILCAIKEKTDINNEAKIDIILCQGLPKQTKMEDIIQKNTEVGVKGFIPVITERTIVKLNDKAKELKKLDRWRKISHESSKQSKRNIVPFVEDILTLDELIDKIKLDQDAKVIVPYELESSKSIKAALKEFDNVKKIYIIIGPEGGFDEKEIDKLLKINAYSVTLGKRILRTETAGLVASAAVMYEFDEMGE